VEGFSVSCLLDTHAVLWLVEGDERLGNNVRKRLLQAGSERWFLSDLSLLEIAMLVAKGRITLEMSLEEYLEQLSLRFVVLPVDAKIATLSTELTLPQADPFDRVILATAKVHGLTLVTRDGKLSATGMVPTLW
jgi:PIN domain nuclease of toxin-antitoxin system